MNLTIGELISQIRNLTKSLRATNLYITDRLIWSLFKKHVSSIFYQEDGRMKTMKMSSIFTTIPYLELIEVDKVEAECLGIKSDCRIKRTKNPLPYIFKGYWGPLIRAVTSLDGEQEILPTNPRQYVRKSTSPNFKYNKNKYYWYLNNHLYFPDLEWDGVKLDAAFENEMVCGQVDDCDYPTSKQLYVPEYVLTIVQAEIIKDLTLPLQLQKNPEEDKNKTI